MATGYFAELFHQFTPLPKKIKAIGWNTGNTVFREALFNMFDCSIVSHRDRESLSKCSNFITTDLIWLREGVEPWREILDQFNAAGDKPLIPISIGLQANEFKKEFSLRPKMVDLFKAMQERTTLAVRGAYTAEILDAHGVQNVRIIGCPSIYQIPLFDGALESLLKAVDVGEGIDATANFRTFDSPLTDSERAFLQYATQNCTGFIEQVISDSLDPTDADPKLLSWLAKNSHAFFDLESWVRHNKRYNFSIGLRFHGNVAALLGGMRALFVTIDSRTREMTKFLGLPSLAINEFDASKPLRDYYDRADYSAFVGEYGARVQNFVDYARGCGLNLSAVYKEKLARVEGLDLQSS